MHKLHSSIRQEAGVFLDEISPCVFWRQGFQFLLFFCPLPSGGMAKLGQVHSNELLIIIIIIPSMYSQSTWESCATLGGEMLHNARQSLTENREFFESQITGGSSTFLKLMKVDWTKQQEGKYHHHPVFCKERQWEELPLPRANFDE